MKKILLFAFVALLSFISCKDDEPSYEPKLIIKLKLDSTQQRLNNIGQPAVMPANHAAQNPQYEAFSAHKIELVPNQFTQIDSGSVIYMGIETNVGGAKAIDWENAIVKNDGEVFLEVPLSSVDEGSYDFIRVSVSYQLYGIYFNLINIPFNGSSIDLNGEFGKLASFVGYNTYINRLTNNIGSTNVSLDVNANKLQGYWAFFTDLAAPYIFTGQAAATTVVNPLSSTVPTPVGSCLVTGTFNNNPLVITGNETEDIELTLSFSTNQSFEWYDGNGNGAFDIDASNNSNNIDSVVDMGLRGLIATHN